MDSQNKITSYSQIVGSIIANYREYHGLGQAEISSKLNISQATWSRIERGSTSVNASQLSEISSLFNVTPQQILARADQMKAELNSRGIKVTHYPKKDNDALVVLGAAALFGLAALLFSNE